MELGRGCSSAGVTLPGPRGGGRPPHPGRPPPSRAHAGLLPTMARTRQGHASGHPGRTHSVWTRAGGGQVREKHPQGLCAPEAGPSAGTSRQGLRLSPCVCLCLSCPSCAKATPAAARFPLGLGPRSSEDFLPRRESYEGPRRLRLQGHGRLWGRCSHCADQGDGPAAGLGVKRSDPGAPSPSCCAPARRSLAPGRARGACRRGSGEHRAPAPSLVGSLPLPGNLP